MISHSPSEPVTTLLIFSTWQVWHNLHSALGSKNNAVIANNRNTTPPIKVTEKERKYIFNVKLTHTAHNRLRENRVVKRIYEGLCASGMLCGQYGRWTFLRDTGGVHQIGWSPHYFLIYLFACIWGANFALVQLIKNHMLNKTKSHFIPELVTCALEDLTMHHLAYTTHLLTRLPESNFHGQYEKSFYLFILVLGERFACVRLSLFVRC